MAFGHQNRQRNYGSDALMLLKRILQIPHLFVFVLVVQPAAVRGRHDEVRGLDPPFRST